MGTGVQARRPSIRAGRRPTRWEWWVPTPMGTHVTRRTREIARSAPRAARGLRHYSWYIYILYYVAAVLVDRSVANIMWIDIILQRYCYNLLIIHLYYNAFIYPYHKEVMSLDIHRYLYPLYHFFHNFCEHNKVVAALTISCNKSAVKLS